MEYVSFDVDGIKEYVFSAYRPSLVQGASELIKSALDCRENEEGEVIKKLRNGFKGMEVVFSCGGSGLLKVNAGEGERVCKELEKIYSEIVPGSSLTAVWHKEESDFPTLLKKLSVKLRIEKNRKALGEKGNTLNGNFEKRCTTCGKGEGKFEKKIGEEKENLCEACNKKHEKTKNEGYPTNMEEIPSSKEKQPHITFIYCDLNNAGSKLLSCKNEDELKNLSSRIYNTISKITENVKSASQDEKNSKPHIITPVIGGDDLIFIIPAERTFEALDEIFKGEEELKEIGTSFSTSFVVSHYHTSIYHLFTVAKESLKRAKEVYYRDSAPGIDFVWLREGMPFKEYGKNDKEFLLTNKPYKRDDFEKVRRIAENLLERNIPSSYLYNLLEIIEGREDESYKKINLFYYVVRNNEMSEVIKSSCNNNLNLEDVYKFFIVQKGLKYYSQFSDVMEIYKILKLRSEK
jgi:hypothetical protein